jgi:hypothetical protein
VRCHLEGQCFAPPRRTREPTTLRVHRNTASQAAPYQSWHAERLIVAARQSRFAPSSATLPHRAAAAFFAHSRRTSFHQCCSNRSARYLFRRACGVLRPSRRGSWVVAPIRQLDRGGPPRAFAGVGRPTSERDPTPAGARNHICGFTEGSVLVRSVELADGPTARGHGEWRENERFRSGNGRERTDITPPPSPEPRLGQTGSDPNRAPG